MRLGIMQPYFFPNLSHFALVAATDEWIVFDVTQYTPKIWMSRYWIMHPGSGCNYLNLSVQKTHLEIRIWQTRIADAST